MIAPVIAGVIWKLMFNPQFGVLNHVLGLGSTFDWLSKDRALASTILVDVWIYTPFVAILVLAGIRSLPKEPFEASDVGRRELVLHVPSAHAADDVAVHPRRRHLPVHGLPQGLRRGLRPHRRRARRHDTTLQIGAFEDSITNLNYSRGSTYMFLLWIIVFITARYLVSVLGKAQRRAAGAGA